MKLLSDEYRQVLRDTKEQHPNWGSTAHTKAEYLDTLIDSIDDSILDYGSGTGSLADELLIHNIEEYDPAITGIDKVPPGSYKYVVSIDVMEHIEPEYLDNVLHHQMVLAKEYIIHYISNCPAVKVLSDGRNAHLIVQPVQWWVDHLDAAYGPAFERVMTDDVGGSFWVKYRRRT